MQVSRQYQLAAIGVGDLGGRLGLVRKRHAHRRVSRGTSMVVECSGTCGGIQLSRPDGSISCLDRPCPPAVVAAHARAYGTARWRTLANWIVASVGDRRFASHD